MNGLVFLLPFILITIIGLSQDSYAATDETIVGINYFDVTNPDGSHTWSSHHEYILDNGIYVPYVQNGLTVNSKIGDVTLNQDGSYTWNGKFDDKIVGKYADISDLTSWTYPSTLNNAVPILSFINDEFHSNKIQTGVANMDYKYVFKDGKWKTELVVTNLSSLTTKVFGFDQIIDLNTDSIEIDGRIYNIDNFDGVVLSKLFLDNNKGKVLDLMNGVNFDFDLGYENLHSVTIHDTGVNSSQLVLDYRTDTILLPNETLIIDPTFGYTTGTGYNIDSVSSTTLCTTALGTLGWGNEIYRPATGVNNNCSVKAVEWDTSSIPDSSIITDVSFRFDIATSTSATTCSIRPMVNQPSISTTQQILDDVLDGTPYVTGSTKCQTNTVGYIDDLGTSADTDLQALLSSDWFGVGYAFDTMTRDGSLRKFSITNWDLQVTYTSIPTPDSITDLTNDSIGLTTASLSFSAPNLNGESLINYMLNVTTPQASPVTTFWMNGTSSPFAVTGLSAGTDYSASASAFTLGGGNWTLANVLNFTTSAGASTPTGLTATDTSISTIDLDWNDAPAYDNITGFRIFRESPTGNGWTLHTSDTASSVSALSDTGLATKTQYNYMIAGINATGVGSNSTAAAATTYGVPDAITGFTITSPTASTLTLDYTAAVPYGYPVTGYMVYRDNTLFSADIGNVTSYVNTGLSAGTSYNYAVKALSAFGNSVSFVNATGITATGPPTGLTVNDCYHTCTTQLNLEWVAPVPAAGLNGYRIFSESPIGNGFTTLVSNTTTTTLYYNNTGLTPGVFYNYKVAALNGGVSENSTAFARSPHKLPDSVTDLVITPNALLQFDAAWTAPTLYGTLTGYQINYTTPAGDPVTIYTSTNPGVTAVISGLNPTVEYSFRVAANTYHGINATGNIANATASSEIAVGDLTFDAGTNPDVEPIWYENYVVDSTTNDVQVRYDAGLTVDCTVTERISGNVNTYTGLSETAETGYVYHNFTVTNAGNDILDWDCYDQTDSLVNGQYSLTQGDAASGLGGFANVPLFSQMSNFTDGLYGTEGNFAGIDLITLFIVIVSMLGFNRQNPALGVGVMFIMLGAAWFYGLIPWTSGALGAIAVVVVLAIGQGTKKD